jgi:AcrR family transcriptional regulator
MTDGTGTASAPAGASRTRRRNRAALLKAARSVFAEMGYGAAGVRDIVRRTDLASGTFYNYFKDKAGIFEAVVREMTVEADAAPSRRPRQGAHRGGILPQPHLRPYIKFRGQRPGDPGIPAATT